MKRLLLAVTLAGCAGLLTCSATRAQTPDSVRYLDRTTGKEDTVKGTIESETAAQVVVKQGARPRTIPAGDVIDVLYDKSIGAGNRLTYRKATNHEGKLDDPKLDPETRRKEFETALAAYRELLPDVKDPAIARHVQFSIARLLVRQAENDPDQVGPAVAELQKFLKDYGDGWQLLQAVKFLGQLQESQGDYAGAEKTYDTLAAKTEVAVVTRTECDLLVARLLIRRKKTDDAEARLKKLARSLKPGDPEGNKVQVYLAQCAVAAGKLDEAESKLKEMLAGTLDGSAKGLVYNALGDIARQRGKAEDAFWDYLWVDVVYNQDRHEQAKALYYLSKLFADVKNDPARAQQCRQRLLDKEFLGMEYQKLAAREKGE
jgi:tetratricopeptide (TPR) repeat protein